MLLFLFFLLLLLIFIITKLGMTTSSTTKSAKEVLPLDQPVSDMSVLDLPELTLDCILGQLPPAGLRSMARVCTELHDRCRSDRLWDRHMREKWGRVVVGSAAAQTKWRNYLASSSNKDLLCMTGRSRRWVGSIACFWPLNWLKSRYGGSGGGEAERFVPDGSIMSWYLSLESGQFWFPAQVYNREEDMVVTPPAVAKVALENGISLQLDFELYIITFKEKHWHVGFILSCYDAELCYDCHTDTFQARYPPHGRRTIVTEEGLQWDRLRAPPVNTSAHELHVSDCLNELCPGDHVEIQWRRNKEFPYGWWYGVVGHLESCDGNEHFCRCSTNDTVLLEFNQYTQGSRWRRTSVNRKGHQEEGNENDGFYGGIRKLHKMDEISTWKQFWQAEVVE